MTDATPRRLVCALWMALAALVAAPDEAEAVRIWEAPRAGWQGPSAGGLSPGSLLTSPDLRLPEFTPPLAAGGHVGASAYPEGVAERWLDIGFTAQPLFVAQRGFDNEASGNFSVPPGVSLQRTRVIVHGQAHPQLQVRLEFNLADRLELLDAYALVPVRRWLQIQLGQFRVPFSRQELVSSSRYQFADRALWAGGAQGSGVRFVPSFDLGVMAWGWLGPRDQVEYYVGVFNGKGANQQFNLDSFFLYAGRVAYNPLGRPRAFQEGAVNMPRDATVSIGLNALRQTRQIGFYTVMGETAQRPNRIGLTAVGADVYASARGASLYGELYFRDAAEADTATTPNTQSLGWLVQAGYFIPFGALREHLEVVARVQSYAPSTCVTRAAGGDCAVRLPASQSREVYRDFMNTTAFTLGLNWYQLGHGFKVQTAYSVINEYSDLQGGVPGSGVVLNDTFTTQLTGSF